MLERNIRNMPEMKKMTPNVHRHPNWAAGHTIQMQLRAKAAPIKWVQVFSSSRCRVLPSESVFGFISYTIFARALSVAWGNS